MRLTKNYNPWDVLKKCQLVNSLNPTASLVHHVSILATERQLYPAYLNHLRGENRPINGVFKLISLKWHCRVKWQLWDDPILSNHPATGIGIRVLKGMRDALRGLDHHIPHFRPLRMTASTLNTSIRLILGNLLLECGRVGWPTPRSRPAYMPVFKVVSCSAAGRGSRTNANNLVRYVWCGSTFQ
jgi:hypothetical protein